MTSEDRETLLRFLASLRAFLEFVAWEKPGTFLPANLRDHAGAGWTQISIEDAFERAESQILSGDFDNALDDHGLGGPQLALKVAAYQTQLRRFWRLTRRRPRILRRSRLRRLARKVMEWADITLGSLAIAIPPTGPAVGGIKEFKEAIETGVRQRRAFGRGVVEEVIEAESWEDLPPLGRG